MIRRLLVFSTVLVALLGLISAPAFADHGVAHNGETADVSTTEGLVQDQVLTVTGHGYEPGATLTVVQCFKFPPTGPFDCELSNYGQYTAEVGADGSASTDYAVIVVEGRCDATTPCFIVVSDGIGPAANAVGTEVTFAEGAPATTTAPTTTAAPATTTAAPTATTAAPATTTAAPDATADVSKTEGLVQDQVVTVTGHGYESGATLTVVQCFRFPVTGPADCELSNYGQYTAEVGADGSASIDYAVNVVEGRCDATTPCFIVVSDGIGPAANAVGTEVTFAEGAPATTTAPTTTAAPATTTAAPAATTAAPATTTAAPDATADVSKTEGLVQDQVVTVTGHGYESGATLTVVQCFRFPVTGPADCELSNYGQYTAEVGADGSASIDYAVNVVEGRCDATTPCFIVVSDGIGPAAIAVGTEVTFAEGTPATTTAPTTTAAPATTTAAPATTAVPVEADTATDDEGDSEAAAGNDETETDGGGLPGWVIPLAIAAVVVGAALASRKKK